MNLLSTLALLFLAIPTVLTAQNSTNEFILSGIISEESSGDPLQGATVYIEELEQGTTTDMNGFYTFTLPGGEYTLRFQYLGKLTEHRNLILQSNTELNISLREGDLDFGEIIVEGVGFGDNIRGVVSGVEVVSIRDLEQLPLLMGEIDVVQSLVSLPGVQTVGEGASGFNVRGGREDQNLVLMDGAPVFNSSHVLGLFSVFNPDVTEGYALYKGHMPERFGGRLSSVLDVSMKSGSARETKVHGGIGLYSARLMVEGPIVKDKTSFLISGRGAASATIFQLAGKGRKMLRFPLPLDVFNSSAWFYDGNASLTHRINTNNKLILSLYGSNDFFRFSDEFGYSWNNRIANLKWNSAFSDDYFSELTVIRNQYGSDFFTPKGADAFLLETGIGYTRIAENMIYTGFKSHTIKAGAEWTYYESDAENIKPYNDTSAIAPDRVEKDRGHELALYLGDEIEINPSLSISFGLRYSQFWQAGPGTEFTYSENVPRSSSSIIDSTLFSQGEKITSYSGLEPRISTRISLSNNSSVKLSYNRTRQYIHQISNSTSPTPADIWQVSTTHLPPQTSHNVSIGYFRNFADGSWETSFDIYYRNVNNLVEYIDFAELFLNNHIETELISGKGEAYGAELTIRKNSGKWNGNFSYTFGRTFVKAGSDFPEVSINNGDWFPSNYDQPHNLNLIATRRLGEESAFSFNFTWRSGRPITAISSNYIDSGTTIPVYIERNQTRIPDYIRLDISFSIAENIWKNRVPNPDRKISDSANITFYNILGRRNAFSVFYRRPANASVPKAHKLSVLGAVIPSFTYNFNF